MSRRKGFTLIELLVVIAIIAILAAILFPVFAKAREKARQTSCASNLKQLALAVIMYSGDYDECAPGVGHPWGGNLGGWNYAGAPVNSTLWVTNIEPYVKAKAMFKCPSSPGQTVSLQEDGKYKVWGIWVPDDWNGTSIGYGMNVLLQLSSPPPVDPNDTTTGGSWFQPNTAAWNEGYGGKNFAMLKNPAEVVMLSDTFQPVEGCYDKINITETCGADQADGSGCYIGNDQYKNPDNARHSGGNNWAFCDGHVKWNRYNRYRCAATEGGEGNYRESKDIMTAGTLQHILGVDQIRP